MRNKKVERYKFQALAISFGIVVFGVLMASFKAMQERPIISPVGNKDVITVTYTTEKEVYRDIKISDIVDKIWMLESSRGKAKAGHAVDCKTKGMSNEYGYGVYQDLCFRTHKEATAMIYMWFAQHLETMSLPQALCLYNEGIAKNDCQYYENYLKL